MRLLRTSELGADYQDAGQEWTDSTAAGSRFRVEQTPARGHREQGWSKADGRRLGCVVVTIVPVPNLARVFPFQAMLRASGMGLQVDSKA